ncbi:hypothetical protein J2Z69_003877 [Paenibacillus shirakamiensis]|uniref:DUF4013 domain-containing protein n=1 Tax=Paenibacillus shirakamiensis TaxID=1265935 RepID=A0ABS4JP15_9BACL|nr:hypothetical protein [Paenibacillus shirakamiensis]MBP2002766.1 hypothetical protein [Paenibacillus shirakamiensis]
MNSIRKGWESTRHQIPVVIILFLYQLLWGVFLYRLVQSAVIPLLQRYPDPAPSQLSKMLFLVEGQIELKNSPDVHTYLWLLGGMFALRLFLTPFIDAGILYGLQPNQKDGAGLVFFQGIRYFGKPVFLFYILELILILFPAYWLVPKILELIINGMQTGTDPLIYAGFYIVAWIIYGYFVHQLLLYIKFGYIYRSSISLSFYIVCRHILKVIGISLFLGFITLILFGIFTSISWIWTGMVALILQQTYPFLRTLLSIWHTASQYQLWNEEK